MSAAALKRLVHVEAMANRHDAEAKAAVAAAVQELEALTADLGRLPSGHARPLLDLLGTARERLNDAWRAEAARAKAWRDLVDAQRPPCCAPTRPCGRTVLERASAVLEHANAAELPAKPRTFCMQGRRLTAQLSGWNDCLEVLDAESGQLVVASRPERHLEVDEYRDGAWPSDAADANSQEEGA